MDGACLSVLLHQSRLCLFLEKTFPDVIDQVSDKKTF